MHRLLQILYLPVMWIPLLVFYRCRERRKVEMDLDAIARICHNTTVKSYTRAFYNTFIHRGAFRNLFYHRVGKWSRPLRWLFPGEPLLGIGTPYGKIGGGLYFQHGYATDVEAESIGENCWINQKVSIAFRGDGRPVIGNNVRIGVGAVIIGKVRIGNNVNIGAGAVVVSDIPDNCTVVPPQAIIVKQDGVKVNSSKIR